MSHPHAWTVFGTNALDIEILLRCRECGAFGIVRDPSQAEWRTALFTGYIYPWPDNGRVVEDSTFTTEYDEKSGIVEMKPNNRGDK